MSPHVLWPQLSLRLSLRDITIPSHPCVELVTENVNLLCTYSHLGYYPLVCKMRSRTVSATHSISYVHIVNQTTNTAAGQLTSALLLTVYVIGLRCRTGLITQTPDANLRGSASAHQSHHCSSIAQATKLQSSWRLFVCAIFCAHAKI